MAAIIPAPNSVVWEYFKYYEQIAADSVNRLPSEQFFPETEAFSTDGNTNADELYTWMLRTFITGIEYGTEQPRQRQ